MFPYGNILQLYNNVSIRKYQVFFKGDTMTFSDRLIKLQKERKLDKKAIFTACNISRISYYRYESGERTPTYEALLALADYFNVSIDYLVGRTDNPEINK